MLLRKRGLKFENFKVILLKQVYECQWELQGMLNEVVMKSQIAKQSKKGDNPKFCIVNTEN